ELWLFEDGKRAPGMGSYAYLPMPARLRLARYTMARTSALSHMMYLIGWEWQEAWSRAEVDQLGAAVSAHNPWGRLVSVHNLDLASNGEVLWPLSGSPWASFAATQAGTSSPSAANRCA